MALRVSESWVRERVQLKHDNLDDVKSLSLPGTYHEKITSLGNSLRSFTRLKHLDLSRNALTTTEGLETLQLLETLNLYYNNICSLKDLRGLRHMTNLKDLDLRLNPVTKNEPDYRLFIVHMLPNLRRLDDRSVRDSERRAAVMHFTTDQAAEFDGHHPSNGISEQERGPIPRVDMVRGLASRPTALEDDDVQVLDLISRTGGDLTQGRKITGSSAHGPRVEDFSREELYRMNHVGTPAKKTKSDHGNVPFGAVHNKPHQKDRVYVHFADDRDTSSDPNLKYTDETNAYTTYNTKGHFTPNPRTTDHQTSPLTNGEPVGRSHALPSPARKSQSQLHGQLSPERPLELAGSRDRSQDVGALLSARSYELSPSSTKKTISSPKQTQGILADRIVQYEESGRGIPTREHHEDIYPTKSEAAIGTTQLEMLNKLLDLVDKYWNGSKSLHRHSKFQSLARKLLLSFNASSSQEFSLLSPGHEKLKTELSERTAEMSKLRDQTSEQLRELERVRSKLQECEIQQGSLDAINHEMVAVKSRLNELHEENGSLKVHIASLEAAKLIGGDQAKLREELQRRNSGLQEQVQSMSQQVQQQKFNLEQLQELTTMLQESHRSLVATNDHLLKELDETRQRHQNEVHQLHWSYDQLKKNVDWVSTGSK